VRAVARAHRAAQQRAPLATLGLVACAVDRLEEAHEVACDGDPAVAVRIAKAQLRIRENPQERLAAGKRHARHGRRGLSADAGAALHRQLHRRGADIGI
jgi:hypothetical protein